MPTYCFVCRDCECPFEDDFKMGCAPDPHICPNCNGVAVRDYVAQGFSFALKGKHWPGKEIKEDHHWDKKTDFIEKKRKVGKYGRRKGFYDRKTGKHDNQKLTDEWKKMSNQDGK